MTTPQTPREWLLEELASGNRPTLQDIALRFNISRQRGSQIYRAVGHVPPRTAVVRQWTPPVPQPRVITGGVPVPVSASVTGSISELLVAADLLARGYQVFCPVGQTNARVDLIALTRDAKTLRIEVRSGHRRSNGVITWKRNDPHKAYADHYAVVITGQPVEYRPPLE